ncbi:hypothetical protein DV096_11225 [Bradymonadaceae bacterium TMQ3]|nr:hypothetical protein DV096_11225 [Bradymonadaceae bacterium TMQ3]TXC75530.1 hypothetical protein FRC91_12525 [Bradymonadales bacterium TMQ1]
MKELQFKQILQDTWSNSRDMYAPLRVEDFTFEPTIAGESTADVVFTLQWRGRTLSFMGELKSSATPRSMMQAMERTQYPGGGESPETLPALLLPYLSPGIVEQLERADVSAFDLNGNFFIQSPDFVAIRVDRPNAYPTSRDIKKIYTYNSSIVGRFLLRKNRTFEQVNEIYESIQELGGGISLSTLSKVLKGLADDILIEKEFGAIRVLQAQELMQNLIDGYRPPRVREEWKLKLPDDISAQRKIFNMALGEEGWMWSGESSAPAYVATTSPALGKVFTPKHLSTNNPLQEFESQRFYNVILQQTDDAYVYFDRRDKLASPIESCLALSQLDKRERQIAGQIKYSILERFDDRF